MELNCLMLQSNRHLRAANVNPPGISDILSLHTDVGCSREANVDLHLAGSSEPSRNAVLFSFGDN